MALRVRAGRQKCMHPLLTHRVLRSHESVDEAHRPVAMLRVLEDFERFLDHYVLRVFDALGIAEPGDPGLRWPG